jgi:hypothetical protein
MNISWFQISPLLMKTFAPVSTICLALQFLCKLYPLLSVFYQCVSYGVNRGNYGFFSGNYPAWDCYESKIRQKASPKTTPNPLKALLPLALENRWSEKEHCIFPVDKCPFLVYVMLH